MNFAKLVIDVYRTRLQSNRHDKQLHNYVQGRHTVLLKRSLLGQTKVYNELPQTAVSTGTVKAFQKELQRLLKKQAQNQPNLEYTKRRARPWQLLFSTRES